MAKVPSPRVLKNGGMAALTDSRASACEEKRDSCCSQESCKTEPGRKPGHYCFMDKLTREEQVWLSSFNAALVGPNVDFETSVNVADNALKEFRARFEHKSVAEKIDELEKLLNDAIGLRKALSEANGRNFHLQQEMDSTLFVRNKTIEELRSLVEDMAHQINERDHTITELRATKDELEARLIEAESPPIAVGGAMRSPRVEIA